MAATAPASHTREASISDFDRDVSASLSFPALSQEYLQSTSFRFPPQYTSNEPYVFPPRRGSVPVTGSVPVATTSARPRSSRVDPPNQLSPNPKPTGARETGLPGPESPDYTTSPPKVGGPSTPYYLGARSIGRTLGDGVSPTVLNATVRLGPVPNRGGSHNREASELLQVPMLEPNLDEKDPSTIQKRAPPPPGVNMRRGHAHRRSGAISSSDVWKLMNQSAPALPISTKSPAVEMSNNDSSRLSPRLSWSAPVSPGPTAEQPPPTANGDSSESASELMAAQRRQSRVCFIEQVEIIPRPTSEELESSAGKTTSIACVETDDLSPCTSVDTVVRSPSPTRRPHNRTRSNSQTLTQPTAALRGLSDRCSNDRPSTAGAILSSIQTAKLPELVIPEVPTLQKLASPFDSAESSPTKSKKSHKKAKSDFSPLIASSEFRQGDSPETTLESRGVTSDKKKKGKKQIKNWAGNMLGKGKGKHSKKGRKSKSKRAPTPPLSRSSENLTLGENEWVATSWNESYVMMPVSTSPALEIQKIAVSGGHGSPIIDLDAALGPFKSPIEAHTGFAAARRRMHSAASRANGTYFHRRSESMPEMQLFALEEDEDRTMEDVFEEEDEDESTSEEEEEEEEESEEDSDEEEGQICGGDGLRLGITEDQMAGFVQGTEAITATATATATHKRLSTGTITAVTVSPSPENQADNSSSLRRKGAPADIITPFSQESSTNSHFRHSFAGSVLDSPSSFVTASSSPNTPIQLDFPSEDSPSQFNPFRRDEWLGEPGPECFADDIPSLTSSSSTMTMSAVYLTMPSTPSTHGTVSAPATLGGKEKKGKSKSKRWSRVWGFWRSK